jgi:hypothetical protein
MIFLKAKHILFGKLKILFQWIQIRTVWLLIPAIILTASLSLAEDKSTIQESPSSNEEFMRKALRSLFEQTFNDFPKEDFRLIFLKEEEDHPANWLLEDELVSYLLFSNYQVSLGSPDSSYDLPESKSLLYRIIELKLDYPMVKRKSFLGEKLVTRKASINLSFRLEDKTTGKVFWSKRGKEEKSDVVKKSMIKSLNNESYPFLSPALSGDSQGRYLEPALVAAVVGGLIYLFFANR